MALQMTCQSGGTVDIYLEPVLPAPRLMLFGQSPCARALAWLGEVMGYNVEPVQDPAEPPVPRSGATFAVIATMGENDENALAAALEARPSYVGVVASRKRFAEIREALIARGVSAEALDKVHSPAGLDLGGRLPEEVALSIFAQIIQLRNADQSSQQALPAQTTIDPVCGMTVDVAMARHTVAHQGRDYFFCNPRCKDKFLKDPLRFLAS